MKKIIKNCTVLLVFACVGMFSLVPNVSAQYYYYPYSQPQNVYNFDYGYYQYPAYSSYSPYQQNYYSYEYGYPYTYYNSQTYYPQYEYSYNNYTATVYGYYGDGYYANYNYNSNNGNPDVETKSARDIEEHSAELRGEVDMNDFRNGKVFFVYGEDIDDVDNVEDEDTYNDIDEYGDNLQKILVDSDLDNQEDYDKTVYGLDDNTRIYFRLCVEFKDDDGDRRLECGDVENFRTDN